MLPSDRFRRANVLKSDVFSTIERGEWRGVDGVDRGAILRDISTARWWAMAVSRHFAWRERRALAAAQGIDGAPRLLGDGREWLARQFIDGLPLQMASPEGNTAFFKDGKRLLAELRRRRICHNDLAKEPNWLVRPDKRAAVTDFQLATVHRRRGPLFRMLAHEDLRHLLKHKRKYCPEALTASEKRVLQRKSWPARLWMATGKRLYNGITRGLLKTRDREGGGVRLYTEAPALEAALRALPGVTGAAVVGYPYRRKGVGLYAFVEGAGLDVAALARGLAAAVPGYAAPEMIQVTNPLPRLPDGAPAADILKLIATNQTDLIEPLLGDDPGLRAAVAAAVESRLNLTDRPIRGV